MARSIDNFLKSNNANLNPGQKAHLIEKMNRLKGLSNNHETSMNELENGVMKYKYPPSGKTLTTKRALELFKRNKPNKYSIIKLKSSAVVEW